MILRFLPWLRRGAASNITTTDSPSAPANAINTVTIRVNETLLEVPLALHGPGEVRGIESKLVSRQEPRPNATDHAPNYFAAIEWSDEDFPWRFTPSQASGENSRLRPWICLVVVAKTDATRLVTVGNAPLPSMEFSLSDLPNLDESHAWAHVQVVAEPSEGSATPSDAQLRAYVDAHPSRALSRLLCPRHLSPKTTYMACVVPTFEAGRLAGLGKSERVSELSPAWTSNAEGQVRLPVYHHWTFSTGESGDFEKLARRLKPVQDLPDTVGTRTLAITGSLAAQLGGETRTTTMGGALRPLSIAAPEEPAWAVSSRTLIRELLNRVAEIEQGANLESSEDDRPVVGPPLYGRWQSGQTQIAEDWQAGWFSQLNSGVESRATAGLGVRIVQENQEEFVAESWKMVGQVEQVNQLLGRAQFAQFLGLRIRDKHIAPLQIGALLPMMAPAQHRTKLAAKSLRATFAEGPVPTAVASTAQRRASRVRSPLLRRWKKSSKSSSIERINAKPQRTGHRAAMVSGMVHLGAIKATKPDSKLDPSRSKSLSQGEINKLMPSLSVSVAAASKGSFDPAARDSYQAAFNTLVGTRRSVAAGPVMPRPADLPALQATILQAIDPAHTIPSRVLGRINGIETFRAPGFESSLDPVVVKPSLNIPLAPKLVADDPNWLLPGADGVPRDAVVVLESRPEFIEAFMAGANHEMHRELRWRRVPSELGGTLLRQFWDVRGASTEYSDDQSTITPIEDWPDASKLGENGQSAIGPRAVFLIRSELVRRFPDATLFLQKAVTTNGSRSPDTTAPPMPVAFRGMLADDSLYVGFDITIDDLRAGEGWYFVVQERFGAPRFGLDVPSDTAFVGNEWTNLSWSHLENGEPNQHVSISDQTFSAAGAIWGRNAGHMAAISIRKPVRVAIHIDKLLPPTP